MSNAALASPPPARPRSTTRRVDELFERQRTAEERLPDPAPLIANLAKRVIEIAAGVRELAQIARWVDEDAYQALAQSVAITARARRAKGRRPAWPDFRLGGMFIEHPADGVVECTVVVHYRARTGAIAMRLVGLDGRWRAIRLQVI